MSRSQILSCPLDKLNNVCFFKMLFPRFIVLPNRLKADPQCMYIDPTAYARRTLRRSLGGFKRGTPRVFVRSPRKK